jgi:trehalose-6-phosphatase
VFPIPEIIETPLPQSIEIPLPQIIVIPVPHIFVLQTPQVVLLPVSELIAQEQSHQLTSATVSDCHVDLNECAVEERRSAFWDFSIDNVNDHHIHDKMHFCCSDDIKDELAVVDLSTTDAVVAQCDVSGYLEIIDDSDNESLYSTF